MSGFFPASLVLDTRSPRKEQPPKLQQQRLTTTQLQTHRFISPDDKINHCTHYHTTSSHIHQGEGKSQHKTSNVSCSLFAVQNGRAALHALWVPLRARGTQNYPLLLRGTWHLTSSAIHSLQGAGTSLGQHYTALFYFCKMQQHMPRDPINQFRTKTKSRLQPSFPIHKAASKPSKWSLRRKLESSQPFFFFNSCNCLFLASSALVKNIPTYSVTTLPITSWSACGSKAT